MTELQHYGVKGMKWGHRKARPITVRQGMRNARTAGQDAWRKTTVEQGGTLIGKKNPVVAKYPSAKARRTGSVAAKAAYKDAAKQSVKNDKAYNKQLRADKKAEKKAVKEDYKKIRKVDGTYDIDYNERGEMLRVRDKRMEAYATLAKEKGQAHALRVAEMEKNKKLAELTATTVGTGMIIVGYLLSQ